MEKMFTQFITENQKRNDRIDTLLNSQQATIRNLEIQMGQLANANAGRQKGSLPSDTIKNSKEQLNAIITRNNYQMLEVSIEQKN